MLPPPVLSVHQAFEEEEEGHDGQRGRGRGGGNQPGDGPGVVSAGVDGQLHPLAPDFHLTVRTSQKLKHSIVSIPPYIPAPVQPFSRHKRMRQETLASQSTSNFNGTYTFFAPNTSKGIPQCLAGYTNPTSLDLYRQLSGRSLVQPVPAAAVVEPEPIPTVVVEPEKQATTPATPA